MKSAFWKLSILLLLLSLSAVAQKRPIISPRSEADDSAAAPRTKGPSLDSLRKMEESRKDSIVPTAKYIRYTKLSFLKDSVQTFQIDTSLNNFQQYNVLNKPDNPSVNLGGNGLSYRDLLFQPNRSIGFQTGFHALDRYVLRSDSVRYYTARSPYTELYYVSGRAPEQVFKVIHTQNVKPNWNVGVNYNRIGGDGLYKNQAPDHLNAAIFTWYRGPKNRYQLMAHALFNHIKAGENGSTVREDIFESDQLFSKDAEFVRLSATGEDRPLQTWDENTLFLKQTYDIGRGDSVSANGASAVLPTQRIAYTISHTKNRYRFFRNEPDTYLVFPHLNPETITLTNDTTHLSHLSNTFNYSFYLRGRSVSFLRNELKVDVGARHDLYQYVQMGEEKKLQNVSLLATMGYRFNDRVKLTANLEQIAQGSQAGDYLYEAQTEFLLSKSVGKIILGAYAQNKSPEQIFNQVNYQFHQWTNNFNRTQIQNLSFQYQNPAIQFSVKGEYFRLADYLYFQETNLVKDIEPVQASENIDMLKLSLTKNFKLGRFNLENLIVYQKTTSQDILSTPELYTFNSFYYDFKLFKVLRTNLGFDVRYHSAFQNPAYAINVGQFYNQQSPVSYATEPVVDIFVRATLKRANLFLKYDYMSQGWFSKGYYTVDRYPMADPILKFGLSWKFYN